jgi:hypothetical protein
VTRFQWFLWALGFSASFVVLSAFAFMKGRPAWYPPVFAAAGAYCLVSVAAAVWRKRRGGVRDSWVQALSTGELGVAALIGIALLFGVLIIFRVGQ